MGSGYKADGERGYFQLMKGLSYRPASKDNWQGLKALFGVQGACGGCWCMLWRLPKKEYDAGKGEGNKRALKVLTESDLAPGILIYSDNEPIAWCSVGPRSLFPRLERSRILKPVDEKPVWSISCLFVKKEWRSKGVSTIALEFAKIFSKEHGAEIIEAYPTEPQKDKMPDLFAWTGIAKAYLKAGFKEVARRSETRPIMRAEL
jgi:GNAT superfamily N-acetyltransferase